MKTQDSVSFTVVRPGNHICLFTSAESLKLLFESSVGFRRNHKSIAKGFTTIKRGYSYEANQKGHVDYYLYDYLENNPYEDFTWCEEMNNNE